MQPTAPLSTTSTTSFLLWNNLQEALELKNEAEIEKICSRVQKELYRPLLSTHLALSYLQNDLNFATFLLKHEADPNVCYANTRIVILALATSNTPFASLLYTHGAYRSSLTDTMHECDEMIKSHDFSNQTTMDKQELRIFIQKQLHLKQIPGNAEGNTYLHELSVDPSIDFTVFKHLKVKEWQVKNSAGVTAFTYCCQKAHFHAIYQLLQFFPDTSRAQASSQALFALLQASRISEFTTLLGYGANPRIVDTNSNTLLHVLSTIQANETQDIARVIDDLVKRGVSTTKKNQAGQTALHLAYDNNNLLTAQSLITNKAPLDDPDSSGKTLLLKALEKNDIAFARRIISEGASRTDSTNSYLCTACSMANYSAVKLLLENTRTSKPADPNLNPHMNPSGESPLKIILDKITKFSASSDEELEKTTEYKIFDLLLKAGAKYRIRSKQGSGKKIHITDLSRQPNLPQLIRKRLDQERGQHRHSASITQKAESVLDLLRVTTPPPIPQEITTSNSPSPRSTGSGSVSPDNTEAALAALTL